MIRMSGGDIARIKFNRDEVVDNVVTLFWEKGYSVSSMQQVGEVTGLKPSSL